MAAHASDRIGDVVIDRWLQQSLRERYSATVREPLPDELTRLLAAEPEPP